MRGARTPVPYNVVRSLNANSIAKCWSLAEPLKYFESL